MISFTSEIMLLSDNKLLLRLGLSSRRKATGLRKKWITKKVDYKVNNIGSFMSSELKVLTKSKHGLISGTLRGLADYYSLNLNGLQLLFLIAGFCGVGIIIYFILWLSIPNYSQRAILLANAAEKQQR